VDNLGMKKETTMTWRDIISPSRVISYVLCNAYTIKKKFNEIGIYDTLVEW
jgi:hypothetical protein